MATCTRTPKPLPASPDYSEKIIVHNWSGQSEPVSLNRAEQTEYVQSCDVILEVDIIMDEMQFFVGSETVVKRHYHVSRVLRGSMPTGGIVCEEYYPEHLAPEEIQPLISAELPQNRNKREIPAMIGPHDAPVKEYLTKCAHLWCIMGIFCQKMGHACGMPLKSVISLDSADSPC